MSDIRDATIERLKQATYGNAILANHMFRLLEEHTMNGCSATDIQDKIDWDSVLDPELNYRENKSRLIKYLRDQGYHSEREMRVDEAARRKEENRLLNMDDKEKREEAAIAEAEETKAKFNAAMEKIVKAEALDGALCEVLPEMKKFQAFLDLALNGTYSNGVIISGAAGLSKSHKVLSELTKRKLPFELYNAHATPLSLYSILYANRNGTVVFDDLEALLEDKKSVGILKAATFSSTGVREVTWNSTARVLEERGLPTRFIFEGKVIVISNEGYENRNASFRALLSRMPVFRLNFNTDARKILVRSVILKQNIFDLPDESKRKVLEYMEGLLDYSKTDDYNLRTAIRAMEIYRMNGEGGKPLIADLLGVDEKMRKLLLIEDKASHLPVSKRIEVWKNYTGYSRSAYHELKAKYFADKYDNMARMEKEMDELDEIIAAQERL